MAVDDQFQKLYNRIIYFVILIPIFFLILFVAVSMLQLREINERIEEGQSNSVKKLINSMTYKDTLSDAYKQFVILAVLEEESLDERYRQGHYSLVSRSFRQYLGFFTGIIMVIVGAVFVLLKLREEIDSSISKGDKWKFSLVTNSPGVVFGIIGAVLISIASTTSDRIIVRDAGIYLSREYLVAPYFGKKQSQEELDEYMRDQQEDEDIDDKDEVTIQHPPSSKDENINTDNKVIIQHPPKN